MIVRTDPNAATEMLPRIVQLVRTAEETTGLNAAAIKIRMTNR